MREVSIAIVFVPDKITNIIPDPTNTLTSSKITLSNGNKPCTFNRNNLKPLKFQPITISIPCTSTAVLLCFTELHSLFTA